MIAKQYGVKTGEAIWQAKEKCPDVIIACMHWGDEYVSLPPQRVKELGDWLIEQGVDHIIGNHPHVIQPIEVHKDSTTAKRNTRILFAFMFSFLL